jgi:hypothetical protein
MIGLALSVVGFSLAVPVSVERINDRFGIVGCRFLIGCARFDG